MKTKVSTRPTNMRVASAITVLQPLFPAWSPCLLCHHNAVASSNVKNGWKIVGVLRALVNLWPMWLLYKDSESRGASIVTEAHGTVGGNALCTFHDHSIPYHLCLQCQCPPCLSISDEIVNMHMVQHSHTMHACTHSWSQGKMISQETIGIAPLRGSLNFFNGMWHYPASRVILSYS